MILGTHRNLMCATLTGVDEGVSPKRMAALSMRYPFVEWGVLLSNNHGKQRYPGPQWIAELEGFDFPQLSLHLCGELVRDLCAGNGTFTTLLPSWPQFQRIQINFSPYIDSVDRGPFFAELLAIQSMHKKFHKDAAFIFQVKNFDHPILSDGRGEGINIHRLLDRSGGKGVHPDKWPAMPPCHAVGYAGGINESNLYETIRNMANMSLYGRKPWIDMESGLRTDNEFDMSKSANILKIASQWPT